MRRLFGDAERTADGGGLFIGDMTRTAGVEIAELEGPDGEDKFLA